MAADSPFGPDPTTTASGLTLYDADSRAKLRPRAVRGQDARVEDVAGCDDERISETKARLPRAQFCSSARYSISHRFDPRDERGESRFDPCDSSRPDAIWMDQDLGKHAGDDDPFVGCCGRQPRNRALVVVVVGAEVSDKNARVED